MGRSKSPTQKIWRSKFKLRDDQWNVPGQKTLSSRWFFVRYCVLLCCFFLGTLPLCRALSLTEKVDVDRTTVENQLGYLPSNYLCVSARSSTGKPIAIKTYPLQRRKKQKKYREISENAKLNFDSPPSRWGTPFPTHYWLTCPDISRAIGELERVGYIGYIVDYLNLESNFEKRQQLLRCHRQCGADRWNSLSESDRQFFLRYAEEDRTVARMKDMIQHSGIAGLNYQEKLNNNGVMEKVSIKCLHTHYSHFRSTMACQKDGEEPSTAPRRKDENPVGRITHELLRANFPLLQL